LELEGGGVRVDGSGIRVQGSGLRPQGLGFRAEDAGVRVWTIDLVLLILLRKAFDRPQPG